MIVVDTSVLIDLLRGRSTPASDRLRTLEVEGTPFVLPGICCQEVLQGAKDEKEWRLLLENFETQRVLMPQDPWATHKGAARLYFDCRRKGLTIRSTIDCFIAQLVLEEEGVLLHDDDDFERIQEVCPLRTMRD